jgi:hypothetical protein
LIIFPGCWGFSFVENISKFPARNIRDCELGVREEHRAPIWEISVVTVQTSCFCQALDPKNLIAQGFGGCRGKEQFVCLNMQRNITWICLLHPKEPFSDSFCLAPTSTPCKPYKPSVSEYLLNLYSANCVASWFHIGADSRSVLFFSLFSKIVSLWFLLFFSFSALEISKEHLLFFQSNETKILFFQICHLLYFLHETQCEIFHKGSLSILVYNPNNTINILHKDLWNMTHQITVTKLHFLKMLKIYFFLHMRLINSKNYINTFKYKNQ